MMQISWKRLIYFLSFFFCSTSHASGYYLYNMYSAPAAGDGGAGGAALANDASTVYANPAGMIRLKNPQWMASGSLVSTGVHFNGTSTWSADGFGSDTQSGKASAGANRLLPELYYVYPTTEKLSLGLSASVPFGLGTYYPRHSVVRYSATMSELKVIDISPNIAYKITDRWSIGGGIDIDYATVRLRAMAGVPTISTSLDSLSKNEGDGWSAGWHAGVLFQLSPDTRFGFNYRSKITTHLKGNSLIQGGAIALLSGGASDVASGHDLKMTLTLPPVSTFSAYHAFNETWAMDGTLTYLQWSELPNRFAVENIASYPTPISAYLPEDYHNAWIIALGGIYHPMPAWLIRSGIFWDETPIKANDLRTVNLPDSSRLGLSVGTHYQATKKLGIDVGWTHQFFNTASMNTNSVFGIQTSHTQGQFHNRIDVIAASITWGII